MAREKTIEEVMTRQPHTISNDLTVRKALEQMRKYGVRHLPVREGGKLVGMVSDRDLAVALFFPEASTTRVDEVMAQDPYTVDPGRPLGQVLREMSGRHLGSAIVSRTDGEVVGIFTAMDAVRLLGATL